IPNFPNYRLGTGYPVCDSNIVYVSSGYVPPPVEEVRVWPNPATSEVTVSLPSTLPKPSTWLLYDQLGREVLTEQMPAGAMEQEINVGNIPPGMYFWRAMSEGALIGSGKLVLAR
nr:T9SS type A sorting domain-containing protein [Saprospiraceae bacterium]